MAYKGQYKLLNRSKYKGNPGKIIYRSSWERNFMVYCDTNPNIIISNGRGLNNAIETTLDGTILSISKRGTIREHFNHEPDKSRPKNSNEIEKLKNSR